MNTRSPKRGISSLAVAALMLSGISLALAAPATAEESDAPAAAPTIVLDPVATPDVTISVPGKYTSAPGAFGTVKIAVSGVTLDGFTFVATSDSAAISNSVAGVSDVTISNSTFTGYTGRTITTGFAEGAGQATERASDWKIKGNKIVQAGNSATAIAVFDVDGVTISDNRVSFEDGTIGRRGFNIDGDTDVVVKKNVLTMSADGASTLAGALSTFATAPWGIQISMSNAPASKVTVTKNKITGAYYGVTGLSQRDVTDLTISENDITAFDGITLNTGSVAPLDGSIVYSGFKIVENDIVATRFGIRLRDLHTPQSAAVPGFAIVTYRDGRIVHNSIAGVDTLVKVSIPETSANLVIDDLVLDRSKKCSHRDEDSSKKNDTKAMDEARC